MFRRIPATYDPHPPGAARTGMRAPSAARRRLGRALLVAALALGAGTAVAQPFLAARMSPDERERLRRELRQQPERGRHDGESGFRRERMSPSERDQLRQQLREARPEERRERWRGRGRD